MDLFDENSTSQVLEDSDNENLIPNLVTSSDNENLTKLPPLEEIRSLNPESTSPDSFSGKFFQCCWDILQSDVVEATCHFFRFGFVSSSLNSNFLIPIPKILDDTSLDNNRPIVMGNFLFKILSTILTDWLDISLTFLLLSSLGLLKVVTFFYCIVATSECVNILDRSSFDGNIALKINIHKAFDTLRWVYLLKVLHSFGFSLKFCLWIRNILILAWVSVLVKWLSYRLLFLLQGCPTGGSSFFIVIWYCRRLF